MMILGQILGVPEKKNKESKSKFIKTFYDYYIYNKWNLEIGTVVIK